MARLRKRFCLFLFLFALLVFVTLMGLKTLNSSDDILAPGLDILPVVGEKLDRRSVSSDHSAPVGLQVEHHSMPLVTNPNLEKGVSYDVHIFYCMWYGNPQMDERYLHWDHVLVPHWDPKISASYPRGKHVPPDDIGSSFYPELGPYSSRDPEVIESHMEQISTALAGTKLIFILVFNLLGLVY